MDLLIIKKWLTDWNGKDAPQIINIIINIFLTQGAIPEGEIAIIEHQTFWCRIMLFIAIITPPWMLFVKPYLIKQKYEQKEIERERRGGDIELREGSSPVQEESEVQLISINNSDQRQPREVSDFAAD
jgi:hypothetical protein